MVVEPDLGGRAPGSCSAYDWALETVLGAALNLKKLATTGVLAAVKTVWGLSFDLSGIVDGPQFAFVTLTASKFLKMKAWAAMPSTQPGVRRVLVKDHQKLVGNVQWWSTCSPALRSLLPSLCSASAFAEGQYLDLLSEAAWLEYDDAKTLLLFFVGMGESRPGLFRASLVDSLDFYDVARLPAGLGILGLWRQAALELATGTPGRRAAARGPWRGARPRLVRTNRTANCDGQTEAHRARTTKTG